MSISVHLSSSRSISSFWQRQGSATCGSRRPRTCARPPSGLQGQSYGRVATATNLPLTCVATGPLCAAQTAGPAPCGDAGTVTGYMYREHAWDDRRHAPYQVRDENSCRDARSPCHFHRTLSLHRITLTLTLTLTLTPPLTPTVTRYVSRECRSIDHTLPMAAPQLAPTPPRRTPGGSGRLGTPRGRGRATGQPATASSARASRHRSCTQYTVSTQPSHSQLGRSDRPLTRQVLPGSVNAEALGRLTGPPA